MRSLWPMAVLLLIAASTGMLAQGSMLPDPPPKFCESIVIFFYSTHFIVTCVSSMKIVLRHKLSGFCVPISTIAVTPPDSIRKRFDDDSQPVGGDGGASDQPSGAVSGSGASEDALADNQAVGGGTLSDETSGAVGGSPDL